MKYLKRFNKISEYETFKEGKDYIIPNLCYVEETEGLVFEPETTPVVPPSEPTLAMAGDVAYWDGSKVKTTPLSKWYTSLGTPVGVVVVPEGFAPDGKVRIIGLRAVNKSGYTSTSMVEMTWGPAGTDTSLTNFARVPTTDNAGSTSSGSKYYGYLPSDNFTGATSFVDPKAKYSGSTPYVISPYLGDVPNPEYYKTISGNNVLSDFNGLSNTQTLVGLGTGYEAANACWKYNDGASNLQWYLPAMGELGYIMLRFNEINTTITTLGGVAVARYGFWSSSEKNSNSVYRLSTSVGSVLDFNKSYTHYVRPFTILDNGDDNESGGTSLEFPIYLVQGDNGQVGIDLYNYINNKATVNEYGHRNYYFSENETVFFSAFDITEKITYMFRLYNNNGNTYSATLSQFGGSTMVLDDTGNITVNWA